MRSIFTLVPEIYKSEFLRVHRAWTFAETSVIARKDEMIERIARGGGNNTETSLWQFEAGRGLESLYLRYSGITINPWKVISVAVLTSVYGLCFNPVLSSSMQRLTECNFTIATMIELNFIRTIPPAAGGASIIFHSNALPCLAL